MSRIESLRNYLFEQLENVTQINAYNLSNEIDNYSLDKIPTQSTVTKWINGTEIHKDVFSFRSRTNYAQDVIVNLQNVGFFEDFENKINSNNKKGILPENIETIECLNCGTLVSAETNTAEFEIQIQITYKIGGK